MTVASVVLTVFLVFVALGYRLDRNLNFTQGGLIQFRSLPDNAVLTIDGKVQSDHTPTKANMNAGQHTVTMSLDGYHSWSKTISLEPGQLLWLNYARLIPNSITTSTLKEYPAIAATSASPDHHWYLIQLAVDAPNFVLVDYSDPKNPKYTALQLPDTLFTKKDNKLGKISVMEWDLQSKFILLRHDNGDTTEFARVDRSKPADAVNLTRVFGLNIRLAHFSGNNPNIIFAKTDDVLRRLDVSNQTASAALVDGLKDFMVYGEDTIAFTSLSQQVTGDAATSQQQIGVYRAGKITPVRMVAANADVRLAYNEYDNHSYLGIATTASSRIDIIRDATVTGSSKEATVFATFDLGRSVQYLSFSSNGRMLVAQNGSTFATYDIEVAKSYTKTLDLGANNVPQLKWLDDYYLWSDAGGKMRIVEFDGTNDHELTSIVPGYDAMISTDSKMLLTIGKNNLTGTILLQASKLALN